MHGQAAGHDGIDGKLLGRDGLFANRLDPQKLVGHHGGPRETGFDGLGGWRHDRQTIRPAIAVKELLRRGKIRNVIDLRNQRGIDRQLHGARNPAFCTR